jgi:ketosteroid isomerase-like protein
MAAELEARVAALERRLSRAEDELAIRDCIVRYGLAVDLGDADAVAECFTPDAEFDVGGGASNVDAKPTVFRGREQIKRDLVMGANHQSLLPDSAHTIGPVLVAVDGDRASATGYSRIYHREHKGQAGDQTRLFRLGYNRWELVRQADGRWRIARRTSRVVGDAEAHGLFRQGLGIGDR